MQSTERQAAGRSRMRLLFFLGAAVVLALSVVVSLPPSPSLQTLPVIEDVPEPYRASVRETEPEVVGESSKAARGAAHLPRKGTATWFAGSRRDPVTWPCQPIPFRLVSAGAPEGAEREVREALGSVSRASGGGITFIESKGLRRWKPDDGFRGITIGWAPDRVAAWEGAQSGKGGGAYTEEHYVRGHVWIRPGATGPSGSGVASVGAVLRHEIAHAVGLGHVDQSVDSLMTPRVVRTDFSDTDKTALRYLAHHACH